MEIKGDIILRMSMWWSQVWIAERPDTVNSGISTVML